MSELGQWLEDTERRLKEATGLDNIKVTGGPYRGCDVSISHRGDIYIADFYSPARFDGRFDEAFQYAVQRIKEHAGGDTEPRGLTIG